jgi:hypothetical protein
MDTMDTMDTMTTMTTMTTTPTVTPTSHHEFIHDQKQVEMFSHLFMDETDGTFMIMQSARKKYNPQVFLRKAFFNRSAYRHGGPVCLLHTLQRYNVPKGCYRDDNSTPLDHDSMVLYMSLNPRNTRKSALEVSKILLEDFYKGAQDFSHVESRWKSQLQKRAQHKIFLTIDLDLKELLEPIYKELLEKGFPYPYAVVETRGGYHLIYRHSALDSQQKEFVFRDLNKRNKIDVFGDPVCPIPGTIQGGFPVRFVDWKLEE